LELVVILCLSIFVQFAAAYFALSLISVTKRWLGWTLIATAVSIMAVARLIIFFQWLYDPNFIIFDINREILALSVSTLMLFGLAWIAPLFRNIQKEMKYMEQSLSDLQSIFNATFEGLLLHENGKIILTNEAFASMFGYEKNELIGRDVSILVDQEYQKKVKQMISEKFIGTYQAVGKKRDGTRITAEISGKQFTYEGRETRLTAVRDITSKLESEKALKDSESRLRSIFENSMIGLYQTTPQGDILLANTALRTMLGFDSFAQMVQKNMKDMGDKAGYARSEFIRLIEKNGEVVGHESRWRKRDGNNLFVRESARAVRDKDGKTQYYEGTIEDITDKKAAEKKTEESVAKLRKAMSGIVQAMGMILESRYPYTAGHQRMVAELSSAIGNELGLVQEKIDALRMAAAVHDLGKISVPAEILAKPGRLTEIENNMIKSYDKIGHDILKTIDFPWPIAEIVYQHNERFDGSGYPRGIGGKQIMLEARILMVADVVEAMASHRPYRPALGIDRALEEIENGSGKLFDPKVVAACISVFKERGFVLETEQEADIV